MKRQLKQRRLCHSELISSAEIDKRNVNRTAMKRKPDKPPGSWNSHDSRDVGPTSEVNLIVRETISEKSLNFNGRRSFPRSKPLEVVGDKGSGSRKDQKISSKGWLHIAMEQKECVSCV
jgi:hypothetical protein